MREEPPRIVVGVDDSPGALAALQWAARQAALTGARLHLIHAWQYRPQPTGILLDPDRVTVEDEQRWAREEVHAVATDTLGEDAVGAATVEAVKGPAGKVLVEKAVGAEALVVGHNAHPPLARALGSVAAHCARHVPCPVVLVPARHPEEEPPAS